MHSINVPMQLFSNKDLNNNYIVYVHYNNIYYLAYHTSFVTHMSRILKTDTSGHIDKIDRATKLNQTQRGTAIETNEGEKEINHTPCMLMHLLEIMSASIVSVLLPIPYM